MKIIQFKGLNGKQTKLIYTTLLFVVLSLTIFNFEQVNVIIDESEQTIDYNDISVPDGSDLTEYIRDINATSGTADDDYGIKIIYTNNAYYTVGNNGSYSFKRNIIFKKWSSYGELIYTRVWGGPGDDQARSIDVDEFGKIWIIGASDSWNTSNNILILRYEQDGTLMSNNTWGGPGDDYGINIQDDYGYMIIMGYSDSWNATFNIIFLQYTFTPTDYTFSKNKTWGDNTNNYIPADIFYDGFNVVTGHNYTSLGINDMFTIKMKPNLIGIDWLVSESLSDDDRGFGVSSDYTDFYVVGVHDFRGTPDLALWKISNTGVLIWSKGIADTDWYYTFDIMKYDDSFLTFGYHNSYTELIEWDTNGVIDSRITCSTGINSWGESICMDNQNNTIGCLSSTDWGESTGYDFELTLIDQDIDGDLLGNATERKYGSSDYDLDSDDDTITDYDEIYQYSTNPSKSDTDSDTMPDNYEINNGLAPTIDDSISDLDGDGVNNLAEFIAETNPQVDDYKPVISNLLQDPKVILKDGNATIYVIIDEPHLDKAILSYKIDRDWINISMIEHTTGNYTAVIPSFEMDKNTVVTYRIYANDTAANEDFSVEYEFTIISEDIAGYSTILTLLTIVSVVGLISRSINRKIRM